MQIMEFTLYLGDDWCIDDRYSIYAGMNKEQAQFNTITNQA